MTTGEARDLAPTPSSESGGTGPPPDWDVDDGVDPARWTADVRRATAAIRQGHLVKDPPFVYFADSRYPLFDLTAAWAAGKPDTQGSVVATTGNRPPYGIVTTQDCDLVEEGRPKRPWAQISPVYFRPSNKGEATGIRSGFHFNYLTWIDSLPDDANGVWVADLRISVPVDKGWFVGRDTWPAFADPTRLTNFRGRLGRLLSRPAYPQSVVDLLLKPLNKYLEQLAATFDLTEIDEIGLELGHDRGDADTARLLMLCRAPASVDLQTALKGWWESSFGQDQPQALTILPPEFALYSRLDTLRYRTLLLLDLSAFSPDDAY